MAFLTSYRAEKVYFEKLRSNIDIAKSYIQRGATDEVMALLQNAVDADGAIMLCYRNLGEVWADLAAQLEKTQKALEDLKTALEEYHDDLNKKIDEINNYLVRLINALDERVTILENESKVKFAYLNHDSVEDVYSIEYNGETADFDALSAALEYPHLLVLIDNENGNIYYPRSVSDVLIDFHADGVSATDYVDISVTMSDSDVVTVTEKTVVNYTFGTGFNVSNTNEVTPDLSVLQAKLSAGFGIEIDSSNEISVDTNDVQEKLIAGQNITLTPDATDPTKTVIEAAGESYSAGFGIDIDSNNEISVDTADVQEKLIAGQNITLTPDSTDPTKTVIDAAGGSNEIFSSKIVNILSEANYTSAVDKTGGTTVLYYTIRSATVANMFANVIDRKKAHWLRFYFTPKISSGSQDFKNAINAIPEKAFVLSIRGEVHISYTDEQQVQRSQVHRLLERRGVVDASLIQSGPIVPLYDEILIDSEHDYSIYVEYKIMYASINGVVHSTDYLNQVYDKRPAYTLQIALMGEEGFAS